MGQLKEGATYIYERADGVTYAREFGEDASTRQAIGWDYDPNGSVHDQLMDAKLWGDIRRSAKDNPALQEALDRVKILYHLSKDNG